MRELVLALPLETGAVDVAVALAEAADQLRHVRERIEQHAPLEPEHRQDQDDADHRDEEREAPERRTRHVRERLGQRDGDHRDGVAGDVADGEHGLERIAAEIPEAA